LEIPSWFKLPKNVPMTISHYHQSQTTADQVICELLSATISAELKEAESRIWHGHPVWFIAGNPIVGYSKQKSGIRLMFWSGADFNEPLLDVVGKKFKDASIFYQSVEQVNTTDLRRWLQHARHIQWDYKNIVKRKGNLERLK
jgi:hypothetical protein